MDPGLAALAGAGAALVHVPAVQPDGPHLQAGHEYARPVGQQLRAGALPAKVARNLNRNDLYSEIDASVEPTLSPFLQMT